MISWNCEPQPPQIIGDTSAAVTVLRLSARWPSWYGPKAQQNCLRALCLATVDQPDSTNDLVSSRPATWM
jgi:hypothetical protein